MRLTESHLDYILSNRLSIPLGVMAADVGISVTHLRKIYNIRKLRYLNDRYKIVEAMSESRKARSKKAVSDGTIEYRPKPTKGHLKMIHQPIKKFKF